MCCHTCEIKQTLVIPSLVTLFWYLVEILGIVGFYQTPKRVYNCCQGSLSKKLYVCRAGVKGGKGGNEGLRAPRLGPEVPALWQF